MEGTVVSAPSVERDERTSALRPVGSRSRVIRRRHRDRDYSLRRVLLGADVAALSLALLVALVVGGTREAPLRDALWILPVLPAWVVLFRSYGLYERPIRRFEPSHLDDLSGIFHALVVGALVFWVYFKFAPVPQLSFQEMIGFGILSLTLVSTMRAAVRQGNLRSVGPERVFAVAPPDAVQILQRKISNHPEYAMELVGVVGSEQEADELGVPLSAPLERIDEALEKLIGTNLIDHVVVQLDATYIPQERLVELKRECRVAGVRFSVFPKERALLLPGVEVNHVEGMGLLTFQPPVLSRASKLMKRWLDVIVSAALLVVAAPVMAAVAIAIRVSYGSPVFFRQVRVGRNDRRFELVKFRTMVKGADDRVGELMEMSVDPDWLIIRDDPRVTKLGRFLRRTSLDELPQLWNVLKGDMSLVGPRPLSERDDRGVSGWERHRLDLVPGLTGPWQVLGRNTIPFREMIEIDYAYVTNWSLWQDIKLLLRTVPVVLRRRGAQ